MCDGERKRSVGKRSFSVDCCLDDLCNTPALTTTTTTSTVAPTTTTTSTVAPITTAKSTVAPTTATPSPTTTTTSTVAPMTTSPSTIISTTTPQPCEDKVYFCKELDKDRFCGGYYEHWAIEKCPKYCNKCPTSAPGFVTTTSTKTPYPCADEESFCANFAREALCQGQTEYWATLRCPKYCNKCSVFHWKEMTGTFFVTGIFISSLVFVLVGGSGQSCQDIDPQACAEMARQNAKMCMDPTLATAVCPKYCHRCPITCYSCNLTTTDVSNCNTLTCTNDQVCMVKEIHSMQTGQHRYVLGCADMLMCDGESKRSVGKRSFSVDCCLDDLCNTPALITTTTTSTVAPTTTATSTASPTTTSTTTIAPTTTSTSTVAPATLPQTPSLPVVATDSPLTTLHPCVDKLPNCTSYDKNTACVGQYEQWAIENCFKYCSKCSK